MPATLETALHLASLGFYIFPLQANSKLPSGHWRQQSTRNTMTITGWFTDKYMGWDPDINIGIDCGKSGLLVADLDNKNGKEGTKRWGELCAANDHEGDCFVVETPSGGHHVYFRAEGYSNTAGLLAEGIDTRGDGGYVVAPSSTIDGKEYSIILSDPPEDMPQWLGQKLSMHRTKVRETGVVITEDDPADVQWAIDFLTNTEVAVEGQAGDHRTYVTFCQLKEHGIGPDTALTLMSEHWNDRCSPPWDHDDLEKKRDSAYKSAQSATGAKSAGAEFQVPMLAPPALTPADKALETLRLGMPLVPFEEKDVPFRDWVFGDMFIRGKVGQITAPGGSSKSTFTMMMALSKASGKNLLNIDPRGVGRVWIYNNEDDMEELRRRFIGMMSFCGITWADITDPDGTVRVMMSSGERIPFQIAKRTDRTGKIKPFHADQMVKEILEFKADMLIIDPFAETHPAQENSNDEIKEVGVMYRLMSQHGHVATCLVHHSRKGDGQSGEGMSGNMDSARGASALSGLVRSMFTLNQMTEKQAKKYGIDENQKWKYVLLDQAKGNLTVGGFQQWYIRETVYINVSAAYPDGEAIGMLRPVNLVAQQDMNPERRTLIADMESVLAAGPLRVGELATTLVERCAFQMDKKPLSLKKTITSFFKEEGIYTSDNGTFYLENTTYNNQQAGLIRFERSETLSIGQML